MTHTKDILADVLEAIPGVPAEMVQRAREGYYHDYLSPLDLPEIQLVKELHDLARLPATPAASRPKLREMARRVADGDFDASKEESEEWMRSPEGQATMRELLGDAAGGTPEERDAAMRKMFDGMAQNAASQANEKLRDALIGKLGGTGR